MTRLLPGLLFPALLFALTGCPAEPPEAPAPAAQDAAPESSENEHTKLQKQADGGDVEAMVTLAEKLGEGDDWKRSAVYYRKAAEQGHQGAMYSLGLIHLEGKLGDQSSDAEAKRWLEKVADAGDADAQGLLASLLTDAELKAKKKQWRAKSSGTEITFTSAEAKRLRERGTKTPSRPLTLSEKKDLERKRRELAKMRRKALADAAKEDEADEPKKKKKPRFDKRRYIPHSTQTGPSKRATKDD